MINFVMLHGEVSSYYPLLMTYVDAIMKTDTNYKMSEYSEEDCINVHFFLESHILAYTGLNGVNVFLPHGIADKGYRNKESVEMFDYTIVSGYLWKQKLMIQGLPEEKIIVGGYPKMDKLFALDVVPRQVLWVPTHNCSIYVENKSSSYPTLLDYWPELSMHYNINVSLHPTTKGNKKPTMEELLTASVVIADSGSTIYEAWALGIPVVFPDWIVKEGIMEHHVDSFEVDIYNNKLGFHANSIDDLIEKISLAKLSGVDVRTRIFIDGIFERDLRGKSGDCIYTNLKILEARHAK